MSADEQELAQRELRQACYHEAAHELLVHMFGGFGDIRIWPNVSQAAIAGEEKAWRGQFRLMVRPGDANLSDAHKRQFGIAAEPPLNWERLVGLAGLVAERMAEGEVQAEQIAASIDGSFDLEEVSETDAALIGADWHTTDVEEVVHLLSSRWSDLVKRAAELGTSANA